MMDDHCWTLPKLSVHTHTSILSIYILLYSSLISFSFLFFPLLHLFLIAVTLDIHTTKRASERGNKKKKKMSSCSCCGRISAYLFMYIRRAFFLLFLFSSLSPCCCCCTESLAPLLLPRSLFMILDGDIHSRWYFQTFKKREPMMMAATLLSSLYKHIHTDPSTGDQL